ncbi:hypothetical protein [Streptomyces sp. NPDC051677]|uniref:hypothetical protein n=1 Tax=Streptomyces sp. NPDC051677 TaxID=3365669 RepID=UPI0037D92EB7
MKPGRDAWVRVPDGDADSAQGEACVRIAAHLDPVLRAEFAEPIRAILAIIPIAFAALLDALRAR